MMDRDAVAKIRALHADTLDILSAFRSIATTEISDGETIHGTVIDTLARQADQMLTEAGEILDDLTRRVRPEDTDAVVAAAAAQETARVLGAGADGHQRDSFGHLTIEGERLKSSLAGWHETLLALRDLAQKRPLRADALEPVLTEIGIMFDELDPIEGREAAS